MGIFRYTWRSFAREMIVLGFAAVFAIPIYILIVLSIKTTSDVLIHPLRIGGKVELSNYTDAWNGSAQISLGQALVSSLIITVGSVIALLTIGSLTAYAIARRPSRLSTTLYLLFVLGFIVPFQLGIVPLYVIMRNLHLTGSYVGMIILYTGLFMPLTVFLYTGFIRVLPIEYEESAQIDGASGLRTFVRVVFPLLRPITGTIAVLDAIFIWNDFFNSLIFLSGTKRATLPVAIYSFVNENLSKWNVIFAAVILSLLPILLFYILAQRQLIRGFSGGIRG